MGCLGKRRRLQRVALVTAVIAGWMPVLQSQQGSKPGAPSSSKSSSSALSDAGSLSDGVYYNNFFGFSCKVPFGWVDRTDVMQDSPSSSSKIDSSRAQVLLAVFERPPEAGGDTPNSAVVIAAESVSSYPGLKSAADYFGPLTEVTKRGGFKVVGGPYEFPESGRQLVRGDFSKELTTLVMHQSSLVMLAKGYVLSFTFISASEDEVEELIEGLSFGGSGAGRKVTAPGVAPKK